MPGFPVARFEFRGIVTTWLIHAYIYICVHSYYMIHTYICVYLLQTKAKRREKDTEERGKGGGGRGARIIV